MRIRFTAPVALVAFGLLLSATAQESPRLPKSQPQSETCVAVDVRVLCVADAVLERMGLDFDAHCKGQQPSPSANAPMAFLNEVQAVQFLEAVQGDKHSTVCAAPKLMVLNGQTACVKIGSERSFVTGMNMVKSEDQAVASPRTETRMTGLELCVQPTVSADRRFVQMKVKSQLTSLVPTVPLFPVTTFITPIYEGGAQGKPVPFTQYIQQPAFNTIRLEKVLAVPDGGTVVLSCPKRPCEASPCENVPALTKLPYLNRLFKAVPATSKMETIVVLLTPRIVLNEGEERKMLPGTVVGLVQPPMPRPVPAMRPAAFSPSPPPVPPPATRPLTAVAPAVMPASCWVSVGKDSAACCTDDDSTAFRTRQVTKLVEMYREACAGGHHAEARKLAAFALELDPACFSKSSAPRSK